MTNTEKQAFWLTKWEYILANDTLNTAQYGIVDSLRLFATANPVESLLEDEELAITYLEDNLEHYKNHFTDAEILMLVELPYYCEDFSIFRTGIYLSSFEISYGPGDELSCTCRYMLSCWHGVGDYCDKELQRPCEQVKKCGIMGTTRCSGRCAQELP
ncbi:MAG: bacteriocin fulvocin C-related protein [Ferruginibacter sp.]|nr:bacteriocin fulvocin C-related protein [Ferruginibacter sp.]